MPEEECEYEPDSKAHEPWDEQERATFDVCKVLKHRDPLRDLSSRLSKHLRLWNNKSELINNRIAVKTFHEN